MEIMTCCDGIRIVGGVLAMGSGAVTFFAGLWAQAAPQAPDLSNPSSALATGAVFTGGAGLLFAASAFVKELVKPYWDHKERMLESEERRLRYQYGFNRNNQVTWLHQQWIEEAHRTKAFPEPPKWIALYDFENGHGQEGDGK
jgi:hypothetical protein